MRALHGDHRPARVAVYGVACLLAYPLALFVLLKSGAVLALALDVERLGAGVAGATAVPLGLVAGYVLLWLWFVVSLWKCAPNADTRAGYRLARVASAALAFLLCAAVLVSVGVPGSR